MPVSAQSPLSTYKSDGLISVTALFEKIILPARYANDLKDIPEAVASFEKSLYREFAGAYTGIGVHHSTMTRNLQDLNRQGHQVVELLVDETKLACAEMPPVGPAGFTVLQLIAQINGRVFVGLPLSRDPAWIGMNIGFLFDSFGAAARLTSWPWWCRPFVAPLTKETRNLRKHRAEAARMLKPFIEQRIKEHERGVVKNEEEKPVDMVQWTLENHGLKASTAEQHMEIQLALLSVSLLGTTILVSNFSFYQVLAPRPTDFFLAKDFLCALRTCCTSRVCARPARGDC
jgi:hypothetical protein